MIALKKFIPSHMTIAGNRVLTSYEGQPLTGTVVQRWGTCTECAQKGGEWEV